MRDGTVDVALLCAGSTDLADLQIIEVAEEDPVALVPREHHLARHAAVTTTQLRQDPAYQEQCPPMGLDEVLDRVALGRLVTVVGSAAASRLTRQVIAIRVTDLPTTTLALGWLSEAPRPEIVAFAEVVQRIVAHGRRTQLLSPLA